MTFSKRTFALVFLVASVANAQRSAQDIESARQLYNEGIELRDKGDVAGALEKLRAAHALGNTAITGLELCRTHAALRQPVEAREVCLGVARIPPAAQETTRSQEARADAGKIAEAERPKIGALHVKVSGVPAGMEPTVTIDGSLIPSAALGSSRAVNPGAHVITARVGTGVETKASLETREGEVREIELVVRPPDPSTTPAPVATVTSPPTAPAPARKNAVATTAFVLAGGAALVGTISGIVAANQEGDLERACVQQKCGPETHDDIDRAKRWANVSTVSFVITGVALAAGVVALLAAPRPTPAARAAPASRGVTLRLGIAGVHGTF